MMQERETGFVPITSVFDEKYIQSVPQLSKMIEADKGELPNFYVLNPMTDSVVPYPGELDDVTKVSPELILLWARRTVLYLELEFMQKEQKELQKLKDKEDSNMTDEQIARMQTLSDSIRDAKEEKLIVIEKHDEMEAKIKAGENEFADVVESYIKRA